MSNLKDKLPDGKENQMIFWVQWGESIHFEKTQRNDGFLSTVST